NAGLSRRRSRVRVPSGPPLDLKKAPNTGAFFCPKEKFGKRWPKLSLHPWARLTRQRVRQADMLGL
ncbi:MAG: hypothetical protein RLN96_06670, partial [Pseudomonadales bacterium]